MRIFNAGMKLSPVTFFAAFCACAGLAHAEPVTMTGGWAADFSLPMTQSANTGTTVFQLEGSYKLNSKSKGDVYFLLTCVGMEAATKVSESETHTKGSGRCELKDKDGDKLLAGMETAFDGFTLHVDGGTGKWGGASGSIVSKETFTVETERLLKGYSNAKGELLFGKH